MTNMNGTPLTKSHGEYMQELKGLLPKEAFLCEPKKILYISGYLVMLSVAYCLFRFMDSLIVYLMLSCLIAHSLSCIGFLSHELSHNSITRNKRAKYFFEIISWGINLIPATLWDRVHNQTHHVQSNTRNDPDRQFLDFEKTSGTYLYTKIFYPNKEFSKWNPIVAFHFIPYIFRNIISVFYSKGSKPTVVPFKPKYSVMQKAKIILELMFITALQIAIFNAVEQKVLAYIFAGPLSYVITSTILMTYIFTNHFLNPITEQSDPILGTTTVEVPSVLNKLHFNFSYHTEHHLFPSINSKFYPVLSTILRKKYTDRYNHLPLGEAWTQLWRNEEFISPDTGKTAENFFS